MSRIASYINNCIACTQFNPYLPEATSQIP